MNSILFDQKRVSTDTNESEFAPKRIVRFKMNSFVISDVFLITMNSFTRNLPQKEAINTRMKLHPDEARGKTVGDWLTSYNGASHEQQSQVQSNDPGSWVRGLTGNDATTKQTLRKK